jgi:hypothetical protein
MWSRPATRIAAIATLVGLALGGCSEHYYDRRDTVSLVSGEAMAANRATHMIDPWPAASGRRDIAYSGVQAQRAAECYRLGTVTRPASMVTTSSAGVSSTATPSTPCNTKASSSSTSSSVK